MLTIIEDTRNQKGKHKKLNAGFEKKGISVVRSKIIVGDYSLPPVVSVDTKDGFGELVKNFCSADRARVKREIIKAQEMGTQLVFLVVDDEATCIEDAKDWENPYGKVKGTTLYKTLDTFTKRYGVRFEFAKPEDQADRIAQILDEETQKWATKYLNQQEGNRDVQQS